MASLFKPTSLTPQNISVDGRETLRFTWECNGAKQEKYSLTVLNSNGVGSWVTTDIIPSPNEYYDLTAGTIDNGESLKWNVTTYNGSDSATSDYAYFTTNATPVTEFVSPDMNISNLYTVENFDNVDLWDHTASAELTEDTVIKLSSYDSSMRVTNIDDGSSMSVYNYYNKAEWNFTKFNNNVISTTDDYVRFIIYIKDSTQYSVIAIQVRLYTNYSSDYFSYSIYKTAIENGWNYITIKKSDFSETGSPDWSDIEELYINIYNSNEDEYLCLQAMQLLKMDYDNEATITTQDYNFEISYSQDQDITLKAFKYILYSSAGVQITDTGWLYDSTLNYEFTGLENGESYLIEGKVLSQEDQEGETGLSTLNVLYDNYTILPDVTTTEYDDEGYILIDFNDIQSRDVSLAATPAYVNGKFNYGLYKYENQNMDMGTLTNSDETDWTLTFWMRFPITLTTSGNYVVFNDLYILIYDGIRFKWFDGSSYVFGSDIYIQNDDAWFFVGITSDYIVIKLNNVLEDAIDISGAETPTSITSVKFNGSTTYDTVLLDNIHGQATKLTYNELIAEDYRYLGTATSSFDTSLGASVLNYNTSIKVSATRNLVLEINIGVGYGYLKLFDNAGNLIDETTYFDGFPNLRGSIIEADTNKYIVLSGAGSYRLYTIVTDTLTYKSANKLINATNTDYSTICKMSEGYFLTAYKENGTNILYLQMVNCFNDTLYDNESDQVEIEGITNSSDLFLVNINSTSAILFFFDITNQTIKNIHISTNLNDITVNTTFDIAVTNTASTYISNPVKINSTHILYTYTKDNDTYAGITVVTDSYLTNLDSKLIYEKTSHSLWDFLVAATGNYYALFFVDSGTSGMKIFEVDSNNNILVDKYIEVDNSTFDSFCANSASSDSVVIFSDLSNTHYQELFSSFQNSVDKEDREAIWVTDSSRFLANFEQTLRAGNVSSDIESFRLKRIASDGSLYNTLSDFDITEHSYIDRSLRNNITYTYILNSIDGDGNEGLGTTFTASLDFYGWFLFDSSNIYKFDLENSSDSINTNLDFNIYNNYTTYPTVGFGSRNYRTGKLNTIPYTYNTTSLSYEFTFDLLEEIKSFINNKTVKYIKNTKGEILKIVTSNFNYKYNEVVVNKPYTISFDWVEVGIGEAGVS